MVRQKSSYIFSVKFEYYTSETFWMFASAGYFEFEINLLSYCQS